MKRHPALVPLSHDHHQALVEARRLRRAPATLSIDGEERELARGETAIVAKGRRRKIAAGRGGVRYLSIHRRRPPPQIGRAADRRS
jgi:hypothetical protein